MFIGFSAFFLIASIVTMAITPRSKVTSGINNNEANALKTYTASYDGNEYAVVSDRQLQRYSLEDNSLLETVNFYDEISNLCQKDGYYFDSESFSEVTLHSEALKNGSGYYLIIDKYGSIFKYDVTESSGKKKLKIDDDNYWLTDRISLSNQIHTLQYRTRSLCIDGDYLYTLSDTDNSYVINVFDINDLSNGIIKSKNFFAFSSPNVDQKIKYGKNVYIVDKINSGDSKSETPYGFASRGDYLYLLTSRGLNRWNKDFYDFDYEHKVESKIVTDHISLYKDANEYFLSQMKTDLLAVPEATKLLVGITDEQINDATFFIGTEMYKEIFGGEAYVNKQIESAKGYADNNKDWLVSFSPINAEESIVIKKTFADVSKNLNCYTSENVTIGGMAYSIPNQELYFLDLKSNHLYSSAISATDFFEFKDSRSLETVSTKTDIDYSGFTFSSSKGNIGFDRNTNNLHVYFYGSRNISMVDLNKKDESGKIAPTIKQTISFEYDIRVFCQNKAGTRIAAFHQTEKRSINNVASFPLHVSVINPSSYQYHGLAIILFIVFIVLFALSVITLLVSFRAYRRTNKMLKLKVIQRDLKRNKFVYLALVPFVVLLIMFCWVEAIGSISFSFFNYTMMKPSYIWNTFGNYIQIFNDSSFWTMFGNTLFFLVFDLFLSIVPPIFFAFCLSVIKSKKLSGVLRGAMFIPAIVPGIASLLIWKVGIFGDTGVLNQVICFFQTGSTSSATYVPINFLHDENLARWSLLLMGFPYVGGYLIFYGGIMNIPKEYDEACQLEGMGVVKRFIFIDLPLIKPQIKYILVMCILSSVQNYERTYMLGSSGTVTFVETMYRQMKDVANPNYGLASAYATLIFIMLLFPVLLNFRSTKKTSMGDQL